MSTIQIPSSIKKVSNAVAVYVRTHFPDVSCIDDVDARILCVWEDKCNHELFYQDLNRFIGDVFTSVTNK